MNKKKLQFLEGLRGIAALVVVFCHLKGAFAIYSTDYLLVYLKESTGSYLISHVIHSVVCLFFDGGLAVHLFWFMSAYVISIKLFTTNDKDYLYKSFGKRYFRLMIPVLGSVLFAYILLSMDLMYNNQLAKIFGQGYDDGWLGGFYDFDANFLKAIQSAMWNSFFSYYSVPSYNSSLWTMQPELYGSLFIFLLFGVLEKRPYRYIFYVIISIIAFLISSYWLVSFILGLFLCDFDHTKSSKFLIKLNGLSNNQIVNCICMLVVLLIAGKPNLFGYFDMLLSIIIVFIVMRTPFLQRILEAKFFIWLGKISFSLYLLHLPIICSFTCYMYMILDFGHIGNIFLASISTLILSFFLSHIYTIYIDDLGIRLARKIGNYLVN